MGVGSLDRAFFDCIDRGSHEALKGLPNADAHAVRAALFVAGLIKPEVEVRYPGQAYLEDKLRDDAGIVPTLLAAYELEGGGRPAPARARRDLLARRRGVEATAVPSDLEELAGKLAVQAFGLQRANALAVPALLYGMAIQRTVDLRRAKYGSPFAYPQGMGQRFLQSVRRANRQLEGGNISDSFRILYLTVRGDPRL